MRKSFVKNKGGEASQVLNRGAKWVGSRPRIELEDAMVGLSIEKAIYRPATMNSTLGPLFKRLGAFLALCSRCESTARSISKARRKTENRASFLRKDPSRYLPQIGEKRIR